jgi:hypothetical protein
MSETSPFTKYILAFLSGAAVAAALIYGLVIPEVRKGATNDEAFARNVQTLQASLQQVTEERDSCTAKFNRATILYDIGLFNNETRAWVLPVDVDPVLAPNKLGSYSHYDPKTQVETVHLKGKAPTQ